MSLERLLKHLTKWQKASKNFKNESVNWSGHTETLFMLETFKGNLMTLKIAFYTVSIVALIVIILIIAGRKSWQRKTAAILDLLASAKTDPTTKVFSEKELFGLPPVVQNFFRKALKEGQPIITRAEVEHSGTFNMSETAENWVPFSSYQRVVCQKPGFIWDARIKMAPGMSVFVHDAYAAGKGILTAKLAGILTVMSMPDSPELAQGELMRFFAEASWYPTSLLPSQGIVWEEIDDSSAAAHLKDGSTSIRLVFQFSDEGLIESVTAEDRYRLVNGTQIATRWQGRFWNYTRINDLLVPMDGEVAWLLPDGPHPYWRGHIEKISYRFSSK